MGYKNFVSALYAPVGNLNAIKDLQSFAEDFRYIEKHVHIDKIYLETFRGFEYIDREKILLLKNFFEAKGIKVSGGITTSDAKWHEYGFTSLCYSDSGHREKIKAVAEMTASIFDEIILDDFFFTNCKCEACIQAKGGSTWSEFRLRQMKEVSKELIVGPARKVNPNVNMIVKYPNWYDCFSETGYNLRDEPAIFDMIYTGTETRDPLYTQQHLQKYLSYFIMRYFENVKPGKNGGGWFDPYECRGNLNYYVEQAYLTLFAKPREVTLFCLGSLLDERFRIFTPLAGYAYEAVDRFLGELGEPVGTACYIPYHSNGENYLHNYVGMLGIPLEPYPYYPKERKKIFLTESAAKDPDIIGKIDRSLRGGGDVIITSGFVRAMAGKGLEQLVTVRWTGEKALVSRYGLSNRGLNLDGVVSSDKSIILPWMHMSNNDVWPLVEGLGANNNLPVLTAVQYGKGRLFILTIPDDFGGLYSYPKEVLNRIRNIMKSAPVTIDAEANVGLFTYDNDTFVVESFLPYPSDIEVIVDRKDAGLQDLVSGSTVSGITVGDTTRFRMNLQQASYKAFRIK